MYQANCTLGGHHGAYRYSDQNKPVDQLVETKHTVTIGGWEISYTVTEGKEM